MVGPRMRLGVFSDTHANYEALSAVLEAYRRERIDVYYCLGDEADRRSHELQDDLRGFLDSVALCH